MNEQVNYAKIQRIQDNLDALTIGQFGTGFVTDAMLYESGIKATVADHTSQLADIAVNLKKYWVGGDTDWTPALNRANTAIATTGGTILIPAGSYDYSNTITFADNVSIICANGTAILNATNKEQAYLKLGSNSVLKNIKLSTTTSVRDSLDTSSRVYALNTSNVTIENVHIDGSGSAGIMFSNVDTFKILNCIVENTMADGIHITKYSKNGLIQGNKCLNTGDDSIAVVSYQSDGYYCENILISKNTIKNSNSRGITHIGGKKVIIESNIIDGTSSSGVLVTQDTNYNTYTAIKTLVKNNIIENVGRYGTIKGNQYGIEITSGATICDIEGNFVYNSYSRGFQCSGGSKNRITNNHFYQCTSCQVDTQDGVIIKGNRFEENTNYGLYCNSLTNSIIDSNIFINNNTSSTAGIDNMNISNSSYCQLINNISIDNRGTPLIDTTFEMYNCNEVAFKNNKSNAGSKVHSYTGTCTNLEKDVAGSTAVPASTIFKSGTMQFKTDTNDLYVYNGTAWKKVTLS